MKNIMRYARNFAAIFFLLLLSGYSVNAQQLSYHGRIVDSITNLGVTASVTKK